VTVKTRGLASLTVWVPEGLAVPLAQEKVMLTVVVSESGLSEKSFLTVKVAEFRVFVIVQVPADKRAEQVPLEL
jgi:hypothetical protein